MTPDHTISLSLQGVQLSLTFVILGFLLYQHKIWIKIKDRINKLWYDYCVEHKMPYDGVDNGKN